MNLPAALFTARWLIRDTFRQARANGILWLMLGVSALCLVFCLSVSTVNLPLREDVSSFEGIKGEVRLGFGAITIDRWSRPRDDAVRYIELLLLGLVADTGGVLLALIWTAAFLPTFLEPSNAAVLLAKPTPRWGLLLGKYLGVLVFVAFQAGVLVGGVWLALGIKTGVWDGTCWLALPLLLFHFAFFFSFSALLAVLTRSTVACVFGSLLFWFLCLSMNLGRHHVWTVDFFRETPGSFLFLVDAGYWALPKPADFGALLMEALQVQNDFAGNFDLKTLEERGGWHPGMSLLSSAIFAIVILAMAAHEFVTTDY
jgi:ABC-2 family transporter protein